MNGVLVIDKPKGWTSHDVVARVRKILQAKKAGHGGTLDPLATGVLPVYLGEGTKLVPFNLKGTKEYVATMRLGQETDTLDADGQVIAERRDFFFTREEIEAVLEKFRGLIQQMAPLFSAIKWNGLPLYKRARAGEKPKLATREIMIHALSLEELSLPFITIAVICGRGTYLRSLCADIGRVLGCGAHLVDLRRLRSGRFSLEQALNLEILSGLVEGGKIGERIIPLKDGVDVSGRIWVGEDTAETIRHGRSLRLQNLTRSDRSWLRIGQRVGLLYGPAKLLAIAESQVDGSEPFADNSEALRILRVFHE